MQINEKSGHLNNPFLHFGRRNIVSFAAPQTPLGLGISPGYVIRPQPSRQNPTTNLYEKMEMCGVFVKDIMKGSSADSAGVIRYVVRVSSYILRSILLLGFD